MKINLSVPSKTFLLGEYVSIVGGPTIVINTEPRFKLSIQSKTSQKTNLTEIFHPESPAGKWAQKHSDLLNRYEYHFEDPYDGAGGLGASSAQFAMLWYATQFLKKPARHPLESGKILKDYRSCAKNFGKLTPSGADVISQMQGEITYFYRSKKVLKRLEWPFDEFDFALIRTGEKVKTHLNLKSLPEKINRQLSQIVLKGLKSFKEKRAEGLAESIQKYSAALNQQELVIPNTLDLLKRIETQSGVIAAKGCGALGADVILAMVQRKKSRSFKSWLKKQNVELIYLGNRVSGGIRMEVDYGYEVAG